MLLPEQAARQTIDAMLADAGWIVQSRHELSLGAGRGVAVREFHLKTGYADYLLFADRKALGAIEAKAVGTTLSGVEDQSEKYSAGLPELPPAWRKPLPFLYESTGVETFFRNGLDPDPRGRRVFNFHRPETLLAWVKEPVSLRGRLRTLPPLLTAGLWGPQIEAIENLEESLAADRPRALIQMATGSGKTFTAVSAIYRLIKHGKAHRVLFLVDRGNLGKQALREFQTYVTPDDGRKFTELYNVQRLTTNTFDPTSKVCVTTIQRLYSILSGQEQFDEANEEQSLFEVGDALGATAREVRYNRAVPPEYFDVVVIDECHRSIYTVWRQVLDYVDAYLIGLTATPYKQTFGFFNGNLVMEYSRQRAVADNINVDSQTYRIRTDITRRGSTVEAGEFVDKLHRPTRKERWEALDEDLSYGASQLDRDVVARDQIRTVIRTFRDRLFTDIFPGHSEVPKTLIFAKDDNHAENIRAIVLEEFGKGGEFCKKITYRVSGVKPDDLIATFRNSYYPRIAVTVDMIATGTDIKPLEILLFMRMVTSRGLYEQMLGRGTRVISPTDLQAVTPDATAKTHFMVVDAVGITEHPKAETGSLDRARSVPLARLVLEASYGTDNPDTLTTLAGRLARLGRVISADQHAEIAAVTGGRGLSDLANALLDAVDPDKPVELARAEAHGAGPTPEAVDEARATLLRRALDPFDDPKVRETLLALQRRAEQTIDYTSRDRLREAGFVDSYLAHATVDSFRAYLDEHRDEIAALRLLFDRPYGGRGLTYAAVKDLARALEQPPHAWTAETLWRAYAQVERDRVRGAGGKRVLTDLVSLVRHALDLDADLAPYPDRVRERYDAWLGAHEAAERPFTPEQRWWLDKIAEYIGVNLTIAPRDLNGGEFHTKGGQLAAVKVFGKDDLRRLLDELNRELVA